MASDKFVSRGGDKLQAALVQFKIDVTGQTILDVGSSTGGFVDCLLQNGAAKVYAVDTAYGEFSWKLRQNPKVQVLERTNILHLQSLPEQVDVVTIDAGWTKLELVLPAIKQFLKPDSQIIALLKPHYQGDKKQLKDGVLSAEQSEQVKERTITLIESLGFTVEQQIDSPILGGGGNKEYLLLCRVFQP